MRRHETGPQVLLSDELGAGCHRSVVFSGQALVAEPAGLWVNEGLHEWRPELVDNDLDGELPAYISGDARSEDQRPTVRTRI
jgi:hypothetical protein